MSAAAPYGQQAEGKNAIPQDAKLDPGTVIYVTVKATAGSEYSGSVTGTYRVVKYDIGKLSAVVEPKTYTGKEVKLSKTDITWKQGGKQVSLPEENFEIIESTYKNNINKGKATVVVHGTGDWGGRNTVKFPIGQRGIVWWVKNILNL